MWWFEVAFIFILGAIIGSFLNVVIIRLNTGKSPTGRSGCMSCGASLLPVHLVPIVSYFYLQGRCAHCGSAISIQYPLVEFFTAVLFVAVWVQGFTFLGTVIMWGVISTAVVITVYDLRHTIIPNTAVYTFGLLSFIWSTGNSFGLPPGHIGLLLLKVFAGGIIVAAPLFFLWFISKGKWMGLGDVKLALGIGWLLGTYGGLNALFAAFVIGAVTGIALLYGGRFLSLVIKHLPLSISHARFTMKSEIPFAPFLLLGCLLVFLFDMDLIAWFEALI
jgi:leader peptidase (prepilin peptidase)/N-methyltransferase